MLTDCIGSFPPKKNHGKIERSSMMVQLAQRDHIQNLDVKGNRFCFAGVLFFFFLRGSGNITYQRSVSIGQHKDAVLQLPEGGGRGKRKGRMTICNTKGALTSSPSKWQDPGRSSIPSVKVKATT